MFLLNELGYVSDGIGGFNSDNMMGGCAVCAVVDALVQVGTEAVNLIPCSDVVVLCVAAT